MPPNKSFTLCTLWGTSETIHEDSDSATAAVAFSAIFDQTTAAVAVAVSATAGSCEHHEHAQMFLPLPDPALPDFCHCRISATAGSCFCHCRISATAGFLPLPDPATAGFCHCRFDSQRDLKHAPSMSQSTPKMIPNMQAWEFPILCLQAWLFPILSTH